MKRGSMLVAAAVLTLAGVAGGPARASFEPRWVAGDLHLHTPYSHDSWAPDDDNTDLHEFYLAGNSVEGHFAVAAARGLDYIAITDHNDIRSQSDPGFGTHGVIGINGYEHSMSGHAQMLGATKLYHHGTGSSGANAMADQLRHDGGVFQINHPGGESVDWPNDPDWKYGYDVIPDTVEVWNIAPQWQPPMPSGHDTEGALDYWEGWLDRGHRVGVTGGSDNHYIATTGIQGAGQPTTWVYVDTDGQDGILEGLRKGRTFVSSQPPAHQGVRLFLEADGDGDGDYESMVGDTVPAGASFVVRAENLPPGAIVRTVSGMADGRRDVSDCTAVAGFQRCTFEARDGDFRADWVRAEAFVSDARAERTALCDEQLGGETTYCRNRLAIVAMTSAIFVSN